MDTVNRGNAYFLSFMFFLSGTKVMCQTTDVYMYCPAEDWIQGSSITFECLVLKTKFPSSCSLPFADTVRFRLDPTGTNGYTDNCSLSTVTSTCSASSNACSCQTGNATYYKFDYTFTAHSDYDGYWDCSVPCFNGLTPQLSYSSDNCDNRTVIAAPTMPPTTATTETETPPTSDQGCPICKKGTDCDEPDLLCLLFLLLLIPIAVVIIIVWYFFCHNGGINATKKAEGGELESLPQDQQTTNGNKPANGNGCGQRDNKAGTGHVAPNGAS